MILEAQIRTHTKRKKETTKYCASKLQWTAQLKSLETCMTHAYIYSWDDQNQIFISIYKCKIVNELFQNDNNI